MFFHNEKDTTWQTGLDHMIQTIYKIDSNFYLENIQTWNWPAFWSSPENRNLVEKYSSLNGTCSIDAFVNFFLRLSLYKKQKADVKWFSPVFNDYASSLSQRHVKGTVSRDWDELQVYNSTEPKKEVNLL
jgi:hypothetical protein